MAMPHGGNRKGTLAELLGNMACTSCRLLQLSSAAYIGGNPLSYYDPYRRRQGKKRAIRGHKLVWIGRC